MMAPRAGPANSKQLIVLGTSGSIVSRRQHTLNLTYGPLFSTIIVPSFAIGALVIVPSHLHICRDGKCPELLWRPDHRQLLLASLKSWREYQLNQSYRLKKKKKNYSINRQKASSVVINLYDSCNNIEGTEASKKWRTRTWITRMWFVSWQQSAHRRSIWGSEPGRRCSLGISRAALLRYIGKGADTTACAHISFGLSQH